MNNQTINIENWGNIFYKEAWDRQTQLQHQAIANKLENKPNQNLLIFCEHYPVITLGKSGKSSNLLINEDVLHAKNIEFFKSDRGGDITYHGPGQITAYLIFDLDQFGLGIKKFVDNIEDSVINTLNHFGIESNRLPGATGVWVGINSEQERKICAIGIKVSRGISMHGLALNVSTDLEAFKLINPCGFVNKSVTSIAKEIQKKISLKEVEERLSNEIQKTFC